MEAKSYRAVLGVFYEAPCLVLTILRDQLTAEECVLLSAIFVMLGFMFVF